MTEYVSSGSGIVNGQYEPPGDYEVFYIHPLEVIPSVVVTLESVNFKNVFIRMDGSKMPAYYVGHGGGVVNCQYGARTYEQFELIKNSDGSYSFRSNEFKNCYLRLDGSHVTERTGAGGGTVNCQHYTYHYEVRSYEKFLIEEQTAN